jgi:ABC-type polysaccharide/polyol phosphate export permease
MVVNLWRYKGYILQNALRGLRHRYAGSAMGVFWNILNPLSQILVYTLVFSRIMNMRTPGMSAGGSYALYLCAGLLPWMAFSETVIGGMGALLQNSNYLKKLPIPEQVFVAQAAASVTLSLFISMSLLFAVSLLMGAEVGWTWLLVPPVLVLFQGFGFGLGLLLSSLDVFFRDIGQVAGIVVRLWMWLTPIVYTKNILPERAARLMDYNPVYPFIDAVQNAVIHGTAPAAGWWGVMAAYALSASLLGYLVLRKLRPELRDVL